MQIDEVSFDVSPEDRELTLKIAQRAVDLSADWETPLELVNTWMDLVATHANGCPLRLNDMLATNNEFSLLHDIAGIYRHLDRKTGQLTGYFSPRFHA